MPVCAAKGCKNRSTTKSINQLRLEETTKITFHAFPGDPKRRAMWIAAMELNESKLHKQAVLCSQHFRNKDIDRTSVSCVRVRADAVPYANLPSKDAKDTTEDKRHSESQESRSQLYTILTSDITKQNVKHCLQNEKLDDQLISKVQRTLSPVETETETIETSSTAIYSTSLYEMLLKKDAAVQTSLSILEDRMGEETTEKSNSTPRTEEKSTFISSQKLFQCPIKQHLREQLKSTKKKYEYEIRKLKQQNRRYSQKIATLKNTLEILKQKNLMEIEEIDD
ncbi:uncharacterized protein LOC128894427 [Hylaeus anthracinus]|uniref:uncharacterized protein LOC128894427 n=1 Tax=Hylaeus anthracinus TaxID=313031 RepID=UPI0023BA18CF|nr:uncharacterized protein LOC128894427 [Hylaeus anthracinus]XP_054012129.1 uncharacterized protein LOC128894427 [Hylaeus anthracinus]